MLPVRVRIAGKLPRRAVSAEAHVDFRDSTTFAIVRALLKVDIILRFYRGHGGGSSDLLRLDDPQKRTRDKCDE